MPFLVALIAATTSTPPLAWLGRSLNLVDRPEGPLKIHSAPISVLGGTGVVASVLVATWASSDLPHGFLILAICLALVVGVVDDAASVSPSIRLLLQATVGVFVAATPLPNNLDLFGAMGMVLLVVTTTNAVNLLDGQDGLAAGVGAIACVSLGILLTWSEATIVASLGFATGGALVGFLVWNRPPARIFLGNGGAYAVGTILAILSGALVSVAGWKGVVAAGLALGVIGGDMVLTILRRRLAGTRLTEGDRGHSYDLLAQRIGRLRSTIVFWAVAALFGSIALTIDTIHPLTSAGIGGLIFIALALGSKSVMKATRTTGGFDRSGQDP